MTYITTTPVYSNVYQLETTDELMAGAGQIMNEQAKNLGNRTDYLKDAIERAWTAYTPSVTVAGGGSVGSNTFLYCAYKWNGKTMIINFSWQVQFSGTITSATLSVPSEMTTASKLFASAFGNNFAASLSETPYFALCKCSNISSVPKIVITNPAGNLPSGTAMVISSSIVIETT